jgi:hypothetical protein
MARRPTTGSDDGAKQPVQRRPRAATTVSAARRRAETTGATAAPRRKHPATARRRMPVAPVPRLVEDDTEVLAAEHAACDAQLLDLLNRLSA